MFGWLVRGELVPVTFGFGWRRVCRLNLGLEGVVVGAAMNPGGLDGVVAPTSMPSATTTPTPTTASHTRQIRRGGEQLTQTAQTPQRTQRGE